MLCGLSWAKWLLGSATAAFVVGSLFAILGPIIFGVAYKDITHHSIHKDAVVSDKHDANYKDWLHDNDIERPWFYSYYLWNLTNPDAALDSSLKVKPVYTLVGPYVYQRFVSKSEVKFLHHGQSVQYMQTEWWKPAENKKTRDPNLDVITNVNHAYFRAVAQSGGEANMQVEVASYQLVQFMEFLVDTFVNDFILNSFSTAWGSRHRSIVEQINATFRNTEASEAYFLAAWANATNEPVIPAEWAGATLTPFGALRPSGISIASANNSLENNHDANVWVRAVSNITLQSSLADQFNLTSAQTHFSRSDVVEPQVFEKWNVSTSEDLAFLQWGSAPLLGAGTSVASKYPQLFPGGPPEFSIALLRSANVSNASLTAAQARHLLTGPRGLLLRENLGSFFRAVSNRNASLLREVWGLSSVVQGEWVRTYLGEYLRRNYSLRLLQGAFDAGGGIITSKTAHRWLWHCLDPLLPLLQLTDTCALANNDTTYGPMRVSTGYNDLSQISKYQLWRGVDQIAGVWAGPLKVQGYSESGMFRPDFPSSGTLQMWDTDLVRPLNLTHVGNRNVRGLNTYYFSLPNDTFYPNPFYFQTIGGFYNMTPWMDGTPMYYSNFYFYGAPGTNSTQKLDGVSPPFPPSEDASRLLTQVDVEPITGREVRASKRLQGNIWAPPDAGQYEGWFSAYNENFTLGTFFPLYQGDRGMKLSEAQANELKHVVHHLYLIGVVCFWVSLGLGFLLFCCCCGCCAGGLVPLWRGRAEIGYAMQMLPLDTSCWKRGGAGDLLIDEHSALINE